MAGKILLKPVTLKAMPDPSGICHEMPIPANYIPIHSNMQTNVSLMQTLCAIPKFIHVSTYQIHTDTSQYISNTYQVDAKKIRSSTLVFTPGTQIGVDFGVGGIYILQV